MVLSLSEILRAAAGFKTKEEKIAFLRQHNSIPLRRILRYAYSPNVEWILPEGNPPYKPLPADQQIGSEMMLLKEVRTCYLFLKGDDEWNPNVPMRKREMMFQELLEAVHPADAELLLACKNRRLPYKELPREIIREAFPDLDI